MHAPSLNRELLRDMSVDDANSIEVATDSFSKKDVDPANKKGLKPKILREVFMKLKEIESKVFSNRQ